MNWFKQDSMILLNKLPAQHSSQLFCSEIKIDNNSAIYHYVFNSVIYTTVQKFGICYDCFHVFEGLF